LICLDLAGGVASDEYDQLAIVGSATLDGMLDVVIDPLFTPQLGDTFDILRIAPNERPAVEVKVGC
jgi:hypothetical protein